MLRVGRYDAHDKWAILCRHWANGEAPSSPDIPERQFQNWCNTATSGGGRAVAIYVTAKRRPQPAEVVEQAGPEPLAVARSLRGVPIGPVVTQLIDALTHGRPPLGETDLSPPVAARIFEVFKYGALEALRWTRDPGEVPTIDIIRSQAGPYPVAALAGKRNALCLFTALFLGRSDVIYVHDAAPDRVTLVDTDARRLETMRLIYPADWRYFCADYRQAVTEAIESGESYDLVIADQPEKFVREFAWDFLPTLIKICSDTVIVNYDPEMFAAIEAEPEDLAAVSQAVSKKTGVSVTFTQFLRRGRLCWMVMRK